MLDEYNYDEAHWHRVETLEVAMDKLQELKELLFECRELIFDKDAIGKDEYDLLLKINKVLEND